MESCIYLQSEGGCDYCLSSESKRESEREKKKVVRKKKEGSLSWKLHSLHQFHFYTF